MKLTPAQYLKAVVGAFSAALATFAGLAANGPVHQAGWIAIGIAFLGAFGTVFVAPNAPAPSVTSVLDERLGNVEAQLPTISDISHAVTGGVVAAIQTSHPSSQPPPREQVQAEAKPDPAPEAPTAEQVFESLPQRDPKTGRFA